MRTRTEIIEQYQGDFPKQYLAGLSEGYSVAITQVMSLLRKEDFGNGELYAKIKRLDSGDAYTAEDYSPCGSCDLRIDNVACTCSEDGK